MDFLNGLNGVCVPKLVASTLLRLGTENVKMKHLVAQGTYQKQRHAHLLFLVLVNFASLITANLSSTSLVNGAFGPWSDWTICAKPCNFDGTANQKRDRVCDSPAPSNNGSDCQGDKEEARRCPLPIEEGGKRLNFSITSHISKSQYNGLLDMMR